MGTVKNLGQTASQTIESAKGVGRFQKIDLFLGKIERRLDQCSQLGQLFEQRIDFFRETAYYRFLHFVGDGNDYQALPARLRMQMIGNPGVDALDFELWCLAASAVTGCGACVVSHDKVVRQKGATAPQVQDAVRIAAVVHALAATLDGLAAAA